MRGLATILLRHSCGRARTARGRAWTCADDCEGPSGADRRYRALDGLRLNCRHGRADRLVEEAFQGFAPKRRPHLGSNGEAGRRLAPKAANPSPLAQSAFRRQAPEVRAGCIEVHVRICAGGARQLASLLRPASSGLPRAATDASLGQYHAAGMRKRALPLFEIRRGRRDASPACARHVLGASQDGRCMVQACSSSSSALASFKSATSNPSVNQQ
jgi:hypothetical protein